MNTNVQMNSSTKCWNRNEIGRIDGYVNINGITFAIIVFEHRIEQARLGEFKVAEMY